MKELLEICTALQSGAVATLVGNRDQPNRSNEYAFLEAGKWVGSEALATVLNIHAVESEQTTLTSDYQGAPVFIPQLLPPVHLLIFGGWLDVLPVIRMGKEVGFHVTVVDPRQLFSYRRLFQEADAVSLCSPDIADIAKGDELDMQVKIKCDAGAFDRHPAPKW
jgi:xanthine/CO dehydrogenase XdhC/CoxF family maturation factor